jgi:hypothetical protein
VFDRQGPPCAEAAVQRAAFRRRPLGPRRTSYDWSESCHLLESLVPAFPYTGLHVVDAYRFFDTCLLFGPQAPITQHNDARLEVRGQSLVSVGDALPYDYSTSKGAAHGRGTLQHVDQLTMSGIKATTE